MEMNIYQPLTTREMILLAVVGGGACLYGVSWAVLKTRRKVYAAVFWVQRAVASHQQKTQEAIDLLDKIAKGQESAQMKESMKEVYTDLGLVMRPLLESVGAAVEALRDSQEKFTAIYFGETGGESGSLNTMNDAMQAAQLREQVAAGIPISEAKKAIEQERLAFLKSLGESVRDGHSTYNEEMYETPEVIELVESSPISLEKN